MFYTQRCSVPNTWVLGARYTFVKRAKEPYQRPFRNDRHSRRSKFPNINQNSACLPAPPWVGNRDSLSLPSDEKASLRPLLPAHSCPVSYGLRNEPRLDQGQVLWETCPLKSLERPGCVPTRVPSGPSAPTSEEFLWLLLGGGGGGTVAVTGASVCKDGEPRKDGYKGGEDRQNSSRNLMEFLVAMVTPEPTGHTAKQHV